MLTPLENQIDVREHSSLSLAFVGDGVMELLVRQRLVAHTRLAPGELHKCAVRFVSAKGQFVGLNAILPSLTEEEQAVVRRGKNATKTTVAKHATAEEYHASTALEALFGWLYLQNNINRLELLFGLYWQAVEQQNGNTQE